MLEQETTLPLSGLREPATAASSQPTVLVVEDDDETRQMLRELLTMKGYRPILAESGEEALTCLDREPVDLALLDLRLPGIHGYDVCRRIRANDAHHLPILMLTANNERDGVVQGLQIGADDYLTKPFLPEELLGRIQALLRRHQAGVALITENEALCAMLDRTQEELQGARTVSGTESTLRREFLHNVTTHLGALCGVIESEFRRQPPGPSREVIQRILGRVRGAALVYQTSEVLQDDPARIDTLVHTIATALKHIYSPRKRLPINVEGGPLALPLIYAAPIAMLVNELVTNCFKHAFPDGRFGSVSVRYGVAGEEFYLQVVDDGVGIADVKSSVGRGQTTVQQLARNLKGTATWESSPSGTEVTVRFPCTP